MSEEELNKMSEETEQPPTSASQPPNQQQMPVRMHLTLEESRILNECNRESFFYRSLPMSIAAVTATQIAVKRGLLVSHPKWGATFKLLGAGFFGWFAGKISYRSACEDKFLHLQNSHLADIIRKKKGYILETIQDSSPDEDITLHSDDAPTYIDDDYVSSSRSLNLDTDKNIQYSGLDDSNRPTGSEYDEQPEDKPQRYVITYEELRRKNREGVYDHPHEQKQFQPPLVSPSIPRLSSSSKDWRSFDDRSSSQQSSYKSEGSGTESTGIKNVYGDRWDK